jgi:hypothetical protein
MNFTDSPKPGQIAFANTPFEALSPSIADFKNIGRIMFYSGQVEAILTHIVTIERGSDGSESAEVSDIDFTSFYKRLDELKANKKMEPAGELADCLKIIDNYVAQREDRNPGLARSCT